RTTAQPAWTVSRWGPSTACGSCAVPSATAARACSSTSGAGGTVWSALPDVMSLTVAQGSAARARTACHHFRGDDWRADRCSAQDPLDPLERDAQPVRAIPGLVADLVQRLVELQGAQELGLLARVRPGQMGVAVEEGLAGTGEPVLRRGRFD